MNQWNNEIRPEEVVVVGDSLNRDVLGAQWSGMRSILLTLAPESADSNRRFEVPRLLPV